MHWDGYYSKNKIVIHCYVIRGLFIIRPLSRGTFIVPYESFWNRHGLFFSCMDSFK